MSIICSAVSQLVGRTPLLALTKLERSLGLQAQLFGKLECCNPSGSVKDRAVLAMLEDARKKGLLKEDSVIIEPTSGNMGISLACLAGAMGCRVVIVMPDSMSPERAQLMSAYGAQVVLTPRELGMQGAVEKAQELAAQIPGSYIPSQFENPANPACHFHTTGPEIWESCGGQADIFVAGVGTGGTITGTGKFLRSKNPNIQIVAIEPASSPLLSRGMAGPHGLQGLGPNFLPAVLDTGVYDTVIPVTEEEAYAAARLMAQKEGVLVGISAGAALHGAIRLAKQEAHAGKRIMVLLPDGGQRYLSTALFQ